MNWILVKDQLPEFDMEVLVVHNEYKSGPCVAIGKLSDFCENRSGRRLEWSINDRHELETSNVTAWMPLPLPPTSAEKEGKII